MAMEWENLLSPVRMGYTNGTGGSAGAGRSEFHKDCDRIIFSSSFRRLGKKTQVHPMASNDHIHTRLTHSIEVAGVGRSLGIEIGEALKSDLPKGITPSNLGQIVQAACLAHDIGNPPFGHAGEEAIRDWFSHNSHQSELFDSLEPLQKHDLFYYEGNAQGFRVVSQLEFYPFEGGMRLTNATLGAMLKYPWTSAEAARSPKFSCFQSELNILRNVATNTGLVEIGADKWCRHPLAFLVEAADDICYRILDLEDAQELGIMSLGEVMEILSPLCSEDRDKIQSIFQSSQLSPRRKVGYLRAKAIGCAIESIAETFIKNIDDILSGQITNELISYCPEEIKDPLDNAKHIAVDKIFNHPRKIELEIGSYTTLGILLDTFCRAARNKVLGGKLSFRSERILSMMGYNAPEKGGSLYESYMRVLDYISGMTDNYATHMAKQIGGMAL